MSLAKAIKDQNAWFNSKQDAFYSWFKDSGKESLQKNLANLSEGHRDGDVKLDEQGKFILDVGEYSFLLVGPDGSVEKLSQTFELSEENTNLEGDEVVVNLFVTVWEEPLEQVRFLPANSQYDFPLIADGDENLIDPLFLSAVDEVYDPYFETIDPLLLSIVDDDVKSYFEEWFHAISEENGDEFNPENILRGILISNLVKVILPLYYNVSWTDYDKDFADRKDAYLCFLQESFSTVKELAFDGARGDVVDMVMGEEAESE